MYTIATLHHLRRRLNLDAGADDERLLIALQSASAQIERLANRRFCPRAATIAHDVTLHDVTELLLDDDLLALTGLTNGDGSAIALSSVLTLPDIDGAVGSLKLLDGEAFVYTDTPLNAVGVTGIWGYHDRWSQAWRDSGDTVRDNPLSSSATTLNVTDANVVDTAQESPRFQVGHLLKIGDEYLRVLSVTIQMGDDALTVQRGVNGTTAASHAQGTAIMTYQPPADVEALAVRWAAWLYREPDNRAASGIPPMLLRELNSLRRLAVKA